MDTYISELVSVIIPCYNSKHTIGKTIKSVLNQTYLNFEIVLVDDCSTDDSRQLLAQYEEQYQQIKCVLLEVNSGAAVARNEGLKAARGQYIAFLDSDDTWVPEKLEKQVDFMRKKQAAFSYTSYDVIDVNNQRIKKPLKIKEHATYKTLLKKTLIATPTAMIDRNMTGEVYMPLKRTGQDYAFWLLLLRRFDAWGMEEVLTHVCRRSNSLSKNKIQNILDVWEVQTKFEHIGKLSAFINVIFYCFYAFKKRLF